MPTDPRHHPDPTSTPPRRSPKRRRALLGLLAVPVVGAVATTVISSTAGAEQTDTAGVVQAEAWSAQNGAQTENTGDVGGGKNVGWLANGDWMRYDGVDLGGTGSLTANVRVAAASHSGGTVELRAGTQTGELLASFPVNYTGGWQTWVTKTAVSTTQLTGKQTVFLVLKSDQRWDFINVNWLRFGLLERMGARRAGPAGAGLPRPGVQVQLGRQLLDKAKILYRTAGFRRYRKGHLPPRVAFPVSRNVK